GSQNGVYYPHRHGEAGGNGLATARAETALHTVTPCSSSLPRSSGKRSREEEPSETGAVEGGENYDNLETRLGDMNIGVFGIGIGWLAEEFQALGIPWERRAQRTREYVEAMRRVWGDEQSDYRGEFVQFAGARSYPKPIKGAKLPVLVGGQSEPALKRAAAYG